jgi:mercuric ion transport protein
MKAGKFGVVSAILASACCIGPLLLAAVGLGAGAAFFGRYHWFFLLGAMAVLAWAWSKYLREKTACECEHKTMEGRRASLYTLLGASVVVAAFLLLNVSRYVSASTPPTTQTAATQTTPAGLKRAVIPVEGMSCVTCEIAVRAALNRVPGVKSAQVSVAGKSATVEFDPAQTSVEQLVSAINATGYRATAPAK